MPESSNASSKACVRFLAEMPVNPPDVAGQERPEHQQARETPTAHSSTPATAAAAQKHRQSTATAAAAQPHRSSAAAAEHHNSSRSRIIADSRSGATAVQQQYCSIAVAPWQDRRSVATAPQQCRISTSAAPKQLRMGTTLSRTTGIRVA